MNETKYPEHPGHKGDLETGRDAAKDMREDAHTLRGKCLQHLSCGNFTADEIARRMQYDILSIRPRISELRRMGKIQPSPERRRNASGKKAAVWMLKEDAQ